MAGIAAAFRCLVLCGEQGEAGRTIDEYDWAAQA